MEGSIYTVDEVSDLLGIPRPTLYRYLREYSIPHLRRAGRIQIPEDSFDRIREARDLHKEGLGTDSVRKQIREGGGPDTGELDRRLNNLHDTLEDLRGELRGRPATGEVALSPALRTVLARQSLMLSAMFNLTGMVEDLLVANGRNRRRTFEGLSDETDDTVLLHAGGGRAAIPGTVLVEPSPVREAEATEVLPPNRILPPDGPTRFGSLGRRRRRGALILLSVLLLGLLLALLLPTLAEDARDLANGGAANGPVNGPVNGPATGDTSGGDAGQDQNGQRAEGPAQQEATRQEAVVNGGEDSVAADASLASREGSSEETGVRTATAPEPSGAIPDVAGRQLEEAARTVSEAGFTVAAIRSEPSERDQGIVLKIEPAAGTNTRPGAPVVLTMSGGPTGVPSASVSSGASTASASSASASPASASSASTSSAGASASALPFP